MVGERDTVQLTVSASCRNKNFRYKWSRRGDQLQSSDRVHGVDSATLTIHDVLLSDGGLYYCNVSNEWGNNVRTSDIRLTVKGL